MGRNTIISAVSIALWLCAWRIAGAGQLFDIAIQEQDGVYSVRVEMQVDAPSDQVYKVLTDYTHMYRLNPSITESKLLPSTREGVVRVLTRIEDCVLVVCLDIVRVDDIRELGYGHFIAEADPQQSDLALGRTVWRILPMHDYCRVVYEAKLQPNFILPPIIGPYVMKDRLREGVLTSLKNLECIAKINTARSMGSSPSARAPADDGNYECKS